MEVEDSSVNVLKMLMVVVKVYNVDDGIPEGSLALLGTRKPSAPGLVPYPFTLMKGLTYSGLPVGTPLGEQAYEETDPQQLPQPWNLAWSRFRNHWP